ncbi:quercetin 2,3-dioxygenase [Cryptosporangium aurantiacum]|uniref:Cupin domain protein n=1 Tax=Cryptosporangium aurantiacum TaxID=134849 RepID=A0A1M7K1A9_9ACTN|nr:quercetin 2,3-dioxygenase [Cryptosporangium aurantiacum]SHM58971.1 Cupin domain protein [Cryptosporangium aurantiacum]
MSFGYVKTPADGPQWWFLDTRMVVKAAAEQTGGAFALIEWSAPAGFGPPLHQHNTEDEAFYLFEGAIDVQCGDDRWTVGPGDFVFLPRGVPHGFVVADGPVRGLQITSPAGFERFVAELGREPEGPGLPEPSAPDVPRLAEASGRYGHEILGPPLTAWSTTLTA